MTRPVFKNGNLGDFFISGIIGDVTLVVGYIGCIILASLRFLNESTGKLL